MRRFVQTFASATGLPADLPGALVRALLAAPDRRAALAAAGRTRAAGFDWRSCAREHLRTYAAAAAA